MASAEDKLAQLGETAETIKRNQQQPISVMVTAPPTRKLRVFSGRTSELHYWSILPPFSSTERLSFLIAHLERPAQEEVRYAPREEKDCIDNIFRVVEKV
ncbi:hypothetical protein LSAT2_002746, partial [Lamellibrachia satsuma]